MQVTTKTLVEMLEYKRPQGTRSQEKYCNRFLRPVFGRPDEFGNYCHVIGTKPRVAFFSHHDTVHATGGKQDVVLRDNRLRLASNSNSNCLGADDTAGNWLMLYLAQRNIAGVYCVFAAEESGGRGSRYMLNSNPTWLDHVEIAVSFDRKGKSSIITHQAGRRTASETFAASLAEQLGGGFEADSGGTFTDSEVFADCISECTNLSVGYFDQHTSRESLDPAFLADLARRLVAVDWSRVVAARDPAISEMTDIWADWRGLMDTDRTRHGYRFDPDLDDMADLVERNPREVAVLLQSLGYDVDSLMQEADITNPGKLWGFR